MLFMCYLMIDIDLLIEDPSPARIFMLLVLLIFICMGIILILVPLCRRQQMKQVIYAITNYRALIFGEQVPLLSDQDYNYSVFDSQREWRRNGCFRSLYKKDLIAFTRRICKNNRSDLFFAEEGVFYPDPAIFDRLTQKTPPRQSTLIGFFNIINSREAEDWLRRIEEVPPLQMPEKFTVVASKKKQLKVTATRAKESKS